MERSIEQHATMSVPPVTRSLQVFYRNAIRSSRLTLMHYLFVVIICLAAFGSSVLGICVWDDEYVVQKNLFIRSLANLPRLATRNYFAPSGIGHYTQSGEETWRPLLTLTHMIEYQLFGLNPHGYHAVNCLLHIAASCALLLMLHHLTASPMISSIGASIFAAHPLNSETVNMVSYREDLLTGLFFCLAFTFMLKNRPFATCSCYLCGLLSKEMTLAFIPCLLVFWLLTAAEKRTVNDQAENLAKRARKQPNSARQNQPGKGANAKYAFAARLKLTNYSWRKNAGLLGALLAVTVSYALFRQWISSPYHQVAIPYPGGSFGLGMATMIRIVAYYIRIFFMPFKLAVDYSFQPSSSIFEVRVLLSFLVIAAVVLAPLIFRAPRRLCFLMWWFFVTLLPVSGIYPLGNSIAERYLYLPIMGWCGTLGWVIVLLGAARERLRPVLGILLALIVTVFIVFNNERNIVWRDEVVFFQEMVRANPLSHKGYSSLGMVYYKRREFAGAKQALLEALKIEPNHPIAWHNLGCVYLDSGDPEKAEEAFRRVIAIDPGFTEAHYQLGIVLKKKGDATQAEAAFRQALLVNANFIPAQFQLGALLQEARRYEEARDLYLQVVRQNPSHSGALKNLGILYWFVFQDPATAAPYFTKYLELVPNDPQKSQIEQLIATRKPM